MAKENKNLICPSCRELGHVSETNPTTGEIEKAVCSTCAAIFSVGNTHIKVEGKHYDEVKDVTSHLIDKLKEIQNEDREITRKKELKQELKKDKFKQLFVAGGFWIGLFFSIGYFFVQIATKDIGWYKFLSIILAFPIFFIIVGAFILKSTSSLKEENFMKLIILTLKLNFKGLNSLTSTAQTNNSSVKQEI